MKAKLFVVLLILCAAASFGQTKKYRLTLCGGMNHVFAYGSAEDYVMESNDFPVTPAHTPLDFGAAFAYFLNDRLGIELRGQSTLAADMTLIDPSDQDTVTIKSAKHMSFSLNLLWEPTPGKVRPYLVLGAGLDKLSARAASYMTDNGYEVTFAAPDKTLDFFINAGAGVCLFVTPSLGIQLDVRYRLLFAAPNRIQSLAASGGVLMKF